MWDLITHGIIPYEWPTEIRDEGDPHLRGIDWLHSSISGRYLEEYQGYQKGQYDRQDPVKMLGRRISEDADIYNEIDSMVDEFPPKLLNQLRTELGSAMNIASHIFGGSFCITQKAPRIQRPICEFSQQESPRAFRYMKFSTSHSENSLE
jgi:hypothetical protein